MVARPYRLALSTALLLAASPLAAQISGSASYQFLEAVRNGKGDEVINILSKPGSRIINTRDPSTGEGALHIVTKRGDSKYLRYLLQQGADPNLRDGKGNTALILAVQLGQDNLVPILTDGKANVNLGNSSGETPLIMAVHRRNLELMRALIDAGADPDQTDIIAGKSARDYAREDNREPALAKYLDTVPKKTRRAVSGPTL